MSGTYLPSISFDSKISKSQLHWRPPPCCLWVGREPASVVYPRRPESALTSHNSQTGIWQLSVFFHIISDTCLSFSRRHRLHLLAALAMWDLLLKDVSLLPSFLPNWHPNIRPSALRCQRQKSTAENCGRRDGGRFFKVIQNTLSLLSGYILLC